MTEQELRDEFENEVRSHHILIKKKDFQHIYIDEKVNTKWIYFEKGYSLAQETIEKQKKEIEDLRRRSYEYYGLLEQIKLDKKNLEETIKAKDAEIESLKGAYSIVADANTEKLFELEKKDQAIADAREVLNGLMAWFFIKSTRTIPNEFLGKAKAWLEQNK